MKIKFLNLYKNFNKNKLLLKKFDTLIKKNDLIGGPAVKSFENKFSKYIKSPYCVSMGNGTDALEIALESLDLKKNSEIIVPANTWISTAEIVIRQNYKLVLCDIDYDDFGLSITDLKEKINKNTSAIIVVHLFGRMSKIKSVISLIKNKNIKLIEDCAQAHGTKLNNKYAGTFGDIGTFSFYPTKNLGAYGDAGCIITKKRNLSTKCKRIKNHGSLIKYDHKLIGRNSRLDPFQAVVLNEKLKKLNADIRKKNKLARIYFKKLNKLKKYIKLPEVKKNEVHSFHQFVIICNKKRNQLRAFLKNNKIETMIHYPQMLSDMKIFSNTKNVKKIKFAKNLGSRLLSLPISPDHTVKEIEFISAKIIKFYNLNDQ
jgi:dTDP-4-amino-4,6-dideoxygalactose transaminase